MSYSKYDGYFTIRCGSRLDPDATPFPIPDGPRTHEYLDAYNKSCEEHMNRMTADLPYPKVRKEIMSYVHDDYQGRAIIYRPDTEETGLPMMLYTHGGSFAFWTPEYNDFFCASVAEEGNCVVVNLDFRTNIDGVMIPDMYEDAYAGILQAVKNAAEYGADPDKLGIMGDSSGGQMAAGLSLLCRDRGTPALSLRVIMAGGIGFDLNELDNGNVNASKTDLMGAQNVIRRGFDNMEESQKIYYSPINDTEMSKCPATVFLVGTADYMWHEVAVYARKLNEAGVRTEVALYPGMPHGFYTGGCGEASRDAWKYIGESVRKYLA